jgi:hypothetical protein
MNSSKMTSHNYSGEKGIARSVVGNDEERNWRSTKAAGRLTTDEVNELAEHVVALLQWGFFPRRL